MRPERKIDFDEVCPIPCYGEGMCDASFNIVLVHPVIPQNTGSIARLAACTGAALHLVHPLGFRVDEAAVKRAGLDYWPHVQVVNHLSLNAFWENERPKPEQVFCFSKFATKSYATVTFPKPCYLVFGSESKGLPEPLREKFGDRLFQVPMRTNLVRSLNLSQCVAVVLYEALRQDNFSDQVV